MYNQESRIGIDIGGTFTDLIYQDENGKTQAVKVPTTPSNPNQGCIDAIKNTSIKNIEDVTYFLHATTVGLNALLERRGATVGILTTEGFRDTLEIGRGDRAEMYNIKWNPPKPLVPRKLRLGIRERLYADGSVKTKLSKEDVIAALNVFEQQNVNAIAVVYLHAYANPSHELETLKILREAGFKGEISLSHQVTGEYREYERTTTTVIDAFVSGRMGSYLNKIETELRNIGFKGLPLITKSGGGAMTFKDANGSLSQTVMSGPVAGAEGAAELTRNLNLGNLITADVGGTSFDTCVIINGRPKLMYQGEIIGMPVQMPWVDVRSIGAGGGSIAYIDEGGLLKVGPESAGATPGPACYGRGGTRPTITDAAFVLGMLGQGMLASGLILDKQKSIDSIKPLAEKLNLSVEQIAHGVLRIATSSMANTIREITVENGIDPREMKLIAYGGAGPLFADLIIEELQMTDIVIPPFAGNFSAWGLLGTDILYAKSLTHKMELKEDYATVLTPILNKIFTELKSRLDQKMDVVHEVALDIRYRGQEHSLTISVENNNGIINLNSEKLREKFEKEYFEIYNTNLEYALEIVTIRLALRKSLSKRSLQTDFKPEKIDIKSSEAYSFFDKKYVPFKIINRNQLNIGEVNLGPAILIERTTTTYIDKNKSFVLDKTGCVLITKNNSHNA
ncbi:hydantoinase/oxoprolinase family protein [Flavobacteriaceae bacterium LMO-SS05]